MILLDTNFLIALTRPELGLQPEDAAVAHHGRARPHQHDRLGRIPLRALSPTDAAAARALLPNPEPLLPGDAERAADLFNSTGRRRGTLADCMIAATSLRLGASLATANVADFRDFEPMGLRVVQP